MFNQDNIIDRREDAENLPRVENQQWITCRDSAMSGWGFSPGNSYCVWVCDIKHASKVADWVSNRDEMKSVSCRSAKAGEAFVRRNANKIGNHVSIYVVDENHVSLK